MTRVSQISSGLASPSGLSTPKDKAIHPSSAGYQGPSSEKGPTMSWWKRGDQLTCVWPCFFPALHEYFQSLEIRVTAAFQLSWACSAQFIGVSGGTLYMSSNCCSQNFFVFFFIFYHFSMKDKSMSQNLKPMSASFQPLNLWGIMHWKKCCDAAMPSCGQGSSALPCPTSPWPWCWKLGKRKAHHADASNQPPKMGQHDQKSAQAPDHCTSLHLSHT